MIQNWGGEVWKLGKKGYFQCGRRMLHREKWTKLRGPIPKGWVVHHKDHDKQNNRIANLDCMSHREHCKAHLADHIHSESGRKNGAKVLALSAHARGKAISAGRLSSPMFNCICIHCETPFKSRNSFAKACSRKCYRNDYYHRVWKHKHV